MNFLRKSAYLSSMGWPGIYSRCFSQFDGDKDSLLLDGGFSFLIVVRLIRDNWKTVIGNYPTSLIGEILFDLQDGLFRLSALPALGEDELGSRFGPVVGAQAFYWACL